MPIQITYQQFVIPTNERRIRVLHLECKQHKELPAEYTQDTYSGDGTTCCYLDVKNPAKVKIYCNRCHDMIIGEEYTEEAFEMICAYIDRCAQRLASINEKLRKDSAGWNKIITREI